MSRIIMWLFMWSGSKLWKCIDVYAPDGEDEPIRAVTFSNDEEYINLVHELEQHNV